MNQQTSIFIDRFSNGWIKGDIQVTSTPLDEKVVLNAFDLSSELIGTPKELEVSLAGHDKE